MRCKLFIVSLIAMWHRFLIFILLESSTIHLLCSFLNPSFSLVIEEFYADQFSPIVEEEEQFTLEESEHHSEYYITDSGS